MSLGYLALKEGKNEPFDKYNFDLWFECARAGLRGWDAWFDAHQHPHQYTYEYPHFHTPSFCVLSG